MLQKSDLRLLGLRMLSSLMCLFGLIGIITFILYGIIFTSSVQIDGVSVIRVLTVSYEMCTEAVRAVFDRESDLLISYIVIVALLHWILYVFCGAFLLLRKSWARKVIVFYSIYVLLNFLMVRVLTRTFTVDFNTILFFIINITLLFYFTRESVIALFCHHPKSTDNKTNN